MTLAAATITGLSARETWGHLAAKRVPADSIPAFMVEAYANGSKASCGLIVEAYATGNGDSAEHALYRITEL